MDFDNPNYASSNGVLFDKTLTTLIQYPGGKTARFYTDPSGVTSIANFALSDASALTSITIPTGVNAIGNGAFQGAASLTSVTIPASVNFVGANAFGGTTSLVDLYFLGNAPAQVVADAFKNIGDGATVTRRLGTRFKTVKDLWNGLPLSYGRLAKFAGNGNHSGTAPTQIPHLVSSGFHAPNKSGSVSQRFLNHVP